MTTYRPHRTKRLSVLTKGRAKNVQVQVTADQRCLDNVISCRDSYEAILGHRVSTSLIMRRAVDLLARFLHQLKDEAWVADELATLMRSIR